MTIVLERPDLPTRPDLPPTQRVVADQFAGSPPEVLQRPTPGSVEEVLERAAGLQGSSRQCLLDQVVVSQLGLARAVARRYRDRGESVDDLVQVASLALVLAVQRYQPGRGVSFSAFAVPTMTGELRRHFRDRGWDVRPPRRIQELRGRVQAAQHDLTQELGRTPTTGQIAQRLGVDAEDVVETLTASDGYHSLSLDAPSPEGEGTASLADVLGGVDPHLDQVDEVAAVRPLLAGLAARDRHILALRFYRGCTQQEIADDIGVTQMQVSRLLTRALAQVRQQAQAAS